MALPAISRSPSASVRAADGRLPAGRHRVAVAIADRALAQALHDALALRPELIEADADGARVVIADAPLPEGDFGAPPRVLLVGAERPGENAIDSLDPAVILAAATLLAAGYRVLPEHSPAGAIHLSAREQQVLALLVEGASNKLIARALAISVHTAKFHVTAVLEKLGARNRADAVAIALREGLVML